MRTSADWSDSCLAIFLVLVLSETVLVLETMMSEPIFEHERIVSLLTRLIQRTESVKEGAIEYEYRDAEYDYEYEDSPNQALDAERRFTRFCRS